VNFEPELQCQRKKARSGSNCAKSRLHDDPSCRSAKP
jgi:hypothetical protein